MQKLITALMNNDASLVNVYTPSRAEKWLRLQYKNGVIIDLFHDMRYPDTWRLQLVEAPKPVKGLPPSDPVIVGLYDIEPAIAEKIWEKHFPAEIQDSKAEHLALIIAGSKAKLEAHVNPANGNGAAN